MTVGDRIKEIRNSNKLSQADFADKIGIKQSPLSQIEHGKILPSLETLNEIRRVFNISLDWLICGVEDSKNIMPNFTPNYTPNDKKHYVSDPSKKMGSNLVPNSAKETESPYMDPLTGKEDIFFLQHELLEEKERTIYALNEVINSQRDALDAQKALISEYKEQLGKLDHVSSNRKTAG